MARFSVLPCQRRAAPLVASLIVIALVVLACGPAGPQTTTGAPVSQPAAPAAPAEAAKAAPAPAGPVRQLRYATVPSSSSIYTYAVAHAKVINSKVPEVNVTVVETGAGLENVKRLQNGEAELGIAATDVLYRVYLGLDQWKDKPIKNMRWVWTHSALPLLYLVREDSGLKQLEELEGKDFNPGIRGSATENTAKQTLEALGIKPRYYAASTADAVAAIKDRRIVGFVKASAGPRSADAAILDVMTATRLRLLTFSDEQVAKIQAVFPWHQIGTLEANVYKADWNREPVKTWTLQAGIMAMAELSDDLVYKITKAIVEDNQPGGEGIQAGAFPSIKGIDIAKQTVEGLRVPLHAGAERYYRELGLRIADEARSPEAKR